MSASSGPKGYEFQYLASVWAGLHCFEDQGPVRTFFIEKPGTEDFEIGLTEQNLVIEIQVKSERKDVDLNNLAEVLCHFPAHQSVDCALDRIRDDRNRRFLLLSGGRCDNDTRILLCSNEKLLEHRESFQYSQKFLSAMAPAVSAVYVGGKTALKRRREAHCQQLAVDLLSFGDSGAFGRVYISEELSKPGLEKDCAMLLNHKFRISQLHALRVLRDLYDLVITGRDNKQDIYQEFMALIKRNQAMRPMTSDDYLKRPEENVLMQELSQQEVILLKGHRMCGKTDVATSIAHVFFSKGYQYLRVLKITDAIEFLNTSLVEDRICLLEDPFGQQLDSEQLSRQLSEFEELLSGRPKGRMLIVTSNELVWAAIKALSFRKWTDLTVGDPGLARQIWEHLAARHPVSSNLFEAVCAYIEEGQILGQLQPGHLSHLSRNGKLLKGFSYPEIRHFAFVDAQSISNIITGRKSKELYIALALLADFIYGVGDLDLLYLLSDLKEYPAIKDDHLPSGITFGEFEEDEEQHFPSYPSSLQGIVIELEELDNLEEQGFIRYVDGRYLFSHPIHFEAGRFMMQDLPRGMLEMLLERLKRGLSVLSIINTRNAAKLLPYLLEQYSNDRETTKTLIGIAEFGLSSIFPSIRDLCLLAMMRNYPMLSEEQAEKVQRGLVRNYQDTSSLYWYQGQPFHPSEDVVGRRLPSKLYGHLEVEEYTQTCKRLSLQESISAELAWEMLRYISFQSKQFPIDAPPEVLSRLLLYEESFIRKMAAYHILYQSNNPARAMIEQLFKDEHPAVVFYAVKGAIRGWYRYSADFRSFILQKAIEVFKIQEVVYCAVQFMTQFGIGYSHEAFDWRDDIPYEQVADMWKVWGELMPGFFRLLPAYPSVSPPRFIATLFDSQNHLETHSKLNLVHAWSDWLATDAQIMRQDSRYFELCDYYFEMREESGAERNEVLRLFTSHPNRYFAYYSVRKYVECWPDLDADERDILTGVLIGDELALAVALTSEELEVTLLSCVGIDSSIIDEDVTATLASLPRSLIEKCLTLMFIPYTWFTKRNAQPNFWKQVLRHFLSQPSDSMCFVAVVEMFSTLDDEEWAEFLLIYPDFGFYIGKIAEEDGLLEYASLRLAAHLNYVKRKEAEDLLKIATSRLSYFQKNQMLSVLLRYLESIEDRKNMLALESNFGTDFHYQILKDYQLVAAAASRMKVKDFAAEPVVELFDANAASGSLRLSTTLDIVLEYLDLCPDDLSQVKGRIEKHKKNIKDRVLPQEQQLDMLLIEIHEKVKTNFN